jgi:hypothetical protein
VHPDRVSPVGRSAIITLLRVAFSFDPANCVAAERMGSRIGVFFCAVALLQIAGGHWVVLQTTAWIGMAIHYSQRNGIVVGLAQTFDGAHPCSMCRAIKAAKKQEQKKTPLVQAELKKAFLTSPSGFPVYQTWVELDYPGFAEDMESVISCPAVPPPRAA